MKRLLLIGVIGLLMLTGCATQKKGDVVCTSQVDNGIKLEYYLYLTDDGDYVKKTDVEYTFDSSSDASKYCDTLEKYKEEGFSFTKKCNDKTIILEDFRKTIHQDKQFAKDEYIGELTRHGDVTCKE